MNACECGHDKFSHVDCKHRCLLCRCDHFSTPRIEEIDWKQRAEQAEKQLAEVTRERNDWKSCATRFEAELAAKDAELHQLNGNYILFL